MKLLRITIAILLLLSLPVLALCEYDPGVYTLVPQILEVEDGMPAEMHLGPTGQFPSAGVTLDASLPLLYFGQYDCWAMVTEYSEDSIGVIGWIPAAAGIFPETPELLFEDALPLNIPEDTFLTAEPLTASPSVLMPLPCGTSAVLLAVLDTWGYVQTEMPDGTPLRAFAPLSSLL